MRRWVLKLRRFSSLLQLSILFLTSLSNPGFAAWNRPKLVVVIVIDQFRADYLTRFESRFLPTSGKNGIGGFKYLMSQSAYFPFGQYDTIQCVTSPGHAAILSGAYPYQTGIVSNGWYDRETHQGVASTQDQAYPLVGLESPPAGAGESPKNLIGTTLGDELKNAGFSTRVVSIALKSRASILLGGHRADLSIWFDAQSHQWISSRYYLPDGKLPPWVQNLNRSLKPHLGEMVTWNLTEEGTGYSAENSLAMESSTQGMGGPSFPHSAKIGSDGILSLPIGVALTRTAAEKAIDAYQLGHGKSTDLLAISFSTHDILGHAFGPNSREMEEITVVEDREISHLLNTLQKKIPGGLKNVVIAFTADHGVAPNPDWATTQRLTSGRFIEDELDKIVSTHLDKRFGKPKDDTWIEFGKGLQIYLNRALAQSKSLDFSLIEAEAKAALLQDPRIAYVQTSTESARGIFPPGIYHQQVAHGYYPKRSGDLLVIPKPYFFPGKITSSHTTGYTYDRTVPILLFGSHFRPGIYSTRAEVVDIAPTLSFLTGTLAPNLSEGRVLSEALLPIKFK